MSKKILMSILMLAVAVGIVGAGTYAWWSDSVTSTGNTLSTGSLQLTVNGSSDPLAPVHVGPMSPGDTEDFHYVAKNEGTVDGNLSAVGSFEDVGTGTLSQVLQVENVTVDGTTVAAGPIALSDLGDLNIPAALLAAGHERIINFTIVLPESVTGHMNETVSGDLAFTLDQVHP
jgi:predicted ribosomally synthesized peptide with SipW-like signal peptide